VDGEVTFTDSGAAGRPVRGIGISPPIPKQTADEMCRILEDRGFLTEYIRTLPGRKMEQVDDGLRLVLGFV
jgi:hypothetical protein